MEKIMTLLFVLCLARGNTIAQTDTLIVDNGSVIKKFLLTEIDSITFDNLTGIDDENPLLLHPVEFTLNQNFPNPFNPSTNIQFQLPSAGRLFLRIYDINGGLVNEIFCGEKEGGIHTVQWNGKDAFGRSAASGVYLYSVQFNNSLLTRKMIYLR